MEPYKVGSSKRPDWPLAVVVGAGGMGTAVARRLGQSHRLLIADRDERHVTAVCKSLCMEGYDAEAIVCDVTKICDVERLAHMAKQKLHIRTLAVVVGLSPSMGDFNTIMAVNLVGTAWIADAFLNVLEPGGSGVFISSSSAHMATIGEELTRLLDDPLAVSFGSDIKAASDGTSAKAYMLSKAGIIRLCQRQASAWGQKRLRIVSLSPGLIATPMGAMEFERTPSKYKLLEATPLDREGTMIEISSVVEFLSSDAASFISGTDILVDGGMIGTLLHNKDI